MKTAFLALLLGAALAPAQAEVIPITWDASHRFQGTSSVPPGKFVEVCGKLAQGETVQWSFESRAPLDFNIHYHEAAKVVYPDRRDAMAQGRGTLVAPLAQDYCWMWTHRGSAAATLTFSLQRSGR